MDRGIKMKSTIEVMPTPKEMAEIIWEMDSDEQAQIFAELHRAAGSEHNLMMQFLYVRDDCVKLRDNGDDTALGAFQAMFSSAYKYAWTND